MAGTVQAELEEVGLYGYAFDFLEDAVQVCAVQADMLSNALNGDFGGIAIADIGNDLFHKEFLP